MRTFPRHAARPLQRPVHACPPGRDRHHCPRRASIGPLPELWKIRGYERSAPPGRAPGSKAAAFRGAHPKAGGGPPFQGYRRGLRGRRDRGSYLPGASSADWSGILGSDPEFWGLEWAGQESGSAHRTRDAGCQLLGGAAAYICARRRRG